MSPAMPLPAQPAPSRGPEPFFPPVASAFVDLEIRVIHDASGVDAMLDDFSAAWEAAGKPLLSLDCEATGKNPVKDTPLLLQLATQRDRAYVLNLTCLGASQIETLWRLVREMGVTVLGHNLAYDYKLLRSHGYVTPEQLPRVYDTMLAELALTTGHFEQKLLWLKSVSLKRLVEKYCALEMDKTTRESFISSVSEEELPEVWAPTDEQVEYAAYDVATLFALREAQTKALIHEQLVAAVKLRFDAIIPVVEMELRGMLINQDAWRAFLADVTRQRAVVEGRLVAALSPYEWTYRQQKFFEQQTALQRWEEERDTYDTYLRAIYAEEGSVDELHPMKWGEYKAFHMKDWRARHPRPPRPSLSMEPINLGSPQQMLRALTALGLELDNTGKDERLRVMRGELSDAQRAVMVDYAEFSGLNRILVGFGENVLAMIDPATGRLHSHFNIHVTETGRWSSQNPNFQNMPRQDAIRHAFIADPDMVVVTADYSGQELAVVAALSGDLRMKRDLLAGKDLYREVASTVWHIPVEQVTMAQRQKAKSAVLGINYGLSAKGMRQKQGIPLDEGEALLATIKKKYPQVVAWGDEQAKHAFEHKWVATAAGTKRYFKDPEMPRWQFDTQGRNAPVQGTAADIAYRLIRRAQDRLVPLGILPVNFVHDEVVALAPADMPDAAERLCREMEAAFTDLLPVELYGMTIRVDAHVGPYWTKD